MSVWQYIRGGVRRLRAGQSGRRFTAFHEYRQQQRRAGRSLGRGVTLTVGALLTAGGLAVGWLPGPGGFLAVIGVGLIATESRSLAHALDRLELFAARAWRALRGSWVRGSVAERVAMAGGLVTLVAGVGWIAIDILIG